MFDARRKINIDLHKNIAILLEILKCYVFMHLALNVTTLSQKDVSYEKV